MVISQVQIDGEYRTVGLFIENAKTYIQLASGALVLSVTFAQGVSGQDNLPTKDLYLWVSWLCWLLAILAGATYQYCAAKYLEELEERAGSLFYGRAKPFILLRVGADNPYKLFGALLVFFYLGTVWFAGSAILQLAR